MSGQEPTPEAPPKRAPESILVTPRRRITRYRRTVIAAGLGAVILLVGAGFIIGLGDHRPSRDGAAAPSEAAEPAVLETRLPARYDEGGRLPPPGSGGLPPPEAALERSSGEATASGAGPASPTVSPEVQRARQEAQAARASGPFFGGAQSRAPAPSAAGPIEAAVPASSVAPPPALSPKEQFIVAAAARGPQAPILAREPLSPWEVKAGALISAALMTGINSDLPGPVIAQVTEPVFDHRTGRAVLIPQGARLIGRYDSQVGYGQQRVLVVWTRIVFPSGRSVDLGAMAGLDAAGMSGLTGKVDNHLPRLARAIGLSTLISIGGAAAQNSAGRRDDRVVLQDAAGGVASAASQTGQRLVDRDLQRAPTLVIAPGQAVRVLVDRDLVLTPEAAGRGSSRE